MKFFIYKFSLILSESIHFPWQYCSKILLSDLLCTLLFRSVTQPLNYMCHVINNKNRRHVTYDASIKITLEVPLDYVVLLDLEMIGMQVLLDFHLCLFLKEILVD